MPKGEKYNYFQGFEDNLNCSLKCANMLYNILENFSVDEIESNLEEIHKIEHRGDEGKHIMLKNLARDFLPPLEREDILNLSQIIDDLTDKIEEILIDMYMLNITKLNPQIIEMTKLLIKCCQDCYDVAKVFPNFKMPLDTKNLVIEINKLEEDGDKLYIDYTRQLYENSNDSIEILKWSTIYSCFENCFDICEAIANCIEEIVVKNL